MFKFLIISVISCLYLLYTRLSFLSIDWFIYLFSLGFLFPLLVLFIMLAVLVIVILLIPKDDIGNDIVGMWTG